MTTPTGVPVVGHHDGVRPAGERGDDLVDGRICVDRRERALHRDRDVLVQRVGVLEDEIEECAVLQRPDHVGEGGELPVSHEGSCEIE